MTEPTVTPTAATPTSPTEPTVSVSKEVNSLAFDLDAVVKAVPELTGEASLANFKTVSDLAKSYVNAAKMTGVDKNMLFKLNKDGSIPDEAYKAMGKPDKYEWPKEVKLNLPDDFKNAFMEQAAKLNLTKTQFEELLHFNADTGIKLSEIQTKAHAQARLDAEKAFKTEMGKSADQTVAMAKEALAVFKQDDLWQTLDAAGLTTNPKMMGLLAEIGRMSGEDKLIDGGMGGNKSFQYSPAQAKAQITALKTDDNFKKQWLNATAPGHAEAVRKMNELYEMAYGGEPQGQTF